MAPGPDLHGNYQSPKKEVQCHIMLFPLSSKNFWMVVLLSTIRWTIGSISCPKECTCQYLTVSCTGKLLEEFPTIIPLDTRQLVLAENKLSYLPSLELNFLSDLIYLDCSSNTLGKDLDFTFVSMIKLIYLDLSFNNLTQVTFGTFSQLSSLVVLKLSDNPSLVEIEKDSFANNTLLRHLDVSRCSLMFIDTSTVRDLPNLKRLDIDPANVTCYSPVFMHGLKMLEEVQEELYYRCYIHFSNQDYLFLGLIGFGIFSAGTVLAWLMQICAVIYEFLTATGEDDKEEEEMEN
ncbi:leucine-rich repeat-containing protein 52-like [Crotalus tigris]|uniref:leucine-rich repeat-containing protein 52-like n=1 Tax=Crotalus tigris TaxID=88082 RepID=UPI00192F7960|nr:leucine-rich repeat-containing protein 52-like [Crotalus tigris]